MIKFSFGCGYQTLSSLKSTNGNFTKTAKKFFSHGPFNPVNYKYKLVGTKRLTTEEQYFVNKKTTEFESMPIYNIRHVHPIRQSGPIPPYYGTYTMEDVRRTNYELRAPFEAVPQSTDVEELMRRIPGLTRKEAIKIQSIGLSPWEELDYAYIVVNNGIDVFYESNNSYLSRQVVTNSKGEKVECLFPTNEPDEFTYMNFSLKVGDERMDNAYDPVPGEPPVCPMQDYEHGAPYSFFEYEMDNRIHTLMTEDQNIMPESERPCPTPKNPNCNKELWRPQSDLLEEEEMQSPNWYPKGTLYNEYQKKDFQKARTYQLDSEIKF